MNPFQILRKWKERRKIRRSFDKYVSPGVIKLIERTPKDYVIGPEEKHFQYLVVDLAELQSSDLSVRLDTICDAFYRHRAIISYVTPNLIIGYLGFPWLDTDSAETRLQIVNELLAENGSLVRVAHGQCTSLAGNIGGKKRFIYGAVIPGFARILKNLLESDFGTAFEVL